MKKMFEPISLGDIALANRFVMAPMTRNRATEAGLATELMATYYAQRASAGLIISEGIQPSQVGQGFSGTPGLHTPEQVESWKMVTGAVHQAGGRIVAQLMHAGRIGHPALYPSAHLPVAPSAIAAEGKTYTRDGMLDYPTPIALTKSEIARTVDDFATAALNAIAAGFDGVEIHGGNGFLLHQFMAANTNQRGDDYGGSLAARVRLAVEVAQAVTAAIGAGRTGMRISPSNPYNDIAEGDSLALYRELVSRLPDLAFLHVMEAYCREQTLAVRENWRGALILNPHASADDGAVSGAVADAVVDEDLADAVVFGALFLANPDLPARILAGGPFNVVDQATLYGGDQRGYTDYPSL
ncbi:alkene reductase [Duganella violaceipulchra]|uniref:N-ethylmaleimide reductase n=2 Tax=Duganella violaceipulchra TaxID=2849652 RepID=A0ABT1GCX7_9BURK|nr:alkene reductase [Duganella violaceicalia]MCP2006812.1 N-ethylmaleimide reductase [Duganella violaceicalia]